MERLLVERARQDAEGFRVLYRHYFPRVYAYVAYRVGRVSDTEDIVAEVFLRVVAHIKSFEYRGEGSFTAWLFRIARSQVGQFYRKPQALPLDAIPEIHSDDPGPDAQLVKKEQFARLYACIAQLSPRRQEVVTLKYFGGLRNQEIAAVLGLDERTVASHLSRALLDLERLYERES